MNGRLVMMAAGVAVVLALGGCGTPESRSREKGGAFSTLPKEQREAALKGDLKKGMSADAVYVALGRPSRVVESVEKGVRKERWIYTQIYTEEVPAWREVAGRGANGQVAIVQRYEPIVITRTEDAFEVRFENGKVVGWGKR